MTTNRNAERVSAEQHDVRGLRIPAAAYAATMVIHGGDHALRALPAAHPSGHHAAWPAGVQVAAAVLTVVISAVLLRLVLTASRHAAPAAMVVGFGSAAVFLGVHLLPQWCAITDSFVSEGSSASAFSWATAIAGISAAFWLGIAGLRQRRHFHACGRKEKSA